LSIWEGIVRAFLIAIASVRAVQPMRIGVFIFALISPAAAQAAETSRLEFVAEYIRELGANESMRELAARDIAETGTDKNSAMIRSSTRIILELNAQMTALEEIALDGQFVALPKNIADFYQQKIDIHKQLIAMASAFMSGPKANVDYGALAAKAPQLTATIEYIDRALFRATPLIFATLIADKPDNQGHMSRLRITRAERDELLRHLQIEFGAKMDSADQNYTVSSATVLRDYLSKKGYKCSDDPL
jgi:hypothetical protein